METSAIVRGVRLSAQKGRLVADLVRGKPVDKALNILTFTQKKAAVIIKKALESAIANAEHNDGADIDELRVTKIHVEKAKTLRRFGARAKGRGSTCPLVTLTLRSKGEIWDRKLIPPASVSP